MEINLLEKNKDRTKASFFIKAVSPAYVNTLRRLMTEEVPTMAIEDIEFRNNSSILYDEILAHRLGLVVLKTDLKSYVLPEKCSCKGEGCARCQLTITLKTKGPCTVYASDLKSKDPKVKPVHPKTVLVKLLKDQELEFEATAQLGQGKEHAKWSPGLFYYRNKPVIDVNQSKFNEEDTKFADVCPVTVFEIKNKKVVVDKDNSLKCHLCNACVDAGPEGLVSVTPKKEEYLFFMESWGGLTCSEIAEHALSMLNQQLDEFTDLAKKIK